MSQPRVLVAEDDEPIGRLLGSWLREEGWEVVCAPDGQTALDLILNRHSDIAVLDIRMPLRSGLEKVGIDTTRAVSLNFRIAVLSCRRRGGHAAQQGVCRQIGWQ